MPVFVVLAIVLVGIITVAIKFWFVIVPAIIIGAIIYNVRQAQKLQDETVRQAQRCAAAETERRRVEQAANARRIGEAAENQRKLRLGLESCITRAQASISAIHHNIVDANLALDAAEGHFAANAFGRFWDAVESAANKLADCENKIGAIVQNAKDYRSTVGQLDSEPPPFRLGLDTLPDTSRTENRLSIIVYSAERNFHFASIFEARRTNKFLSRGFVSLDDALKRIGVQLQMSIGSLTAVMKDLAANNRIQSRDLIGSLGRLEQAMHEYASQSRASHHEQFKTARS